jgi:hypothetical protein
VAKKSDLCSAAGANVRGVIQGTQPLRDTPSLLREHCLIQFVCESAYSEWIFFLLNIADNLLRCSGWIASKAICGHAPGLLLSGCNNEKGAIMRARVSAWLTLTHNRPGRTVGDES